MSYSMDRGHFWEDRIFSPFAVKTVRGSELRGSNLKLTFVQMNLIWNFCKICAFKFGPTFMWSIDFYYG